MSATVQPYPWGALDRKTRVGVRAESVALRILREAVDHRKLAVALSELLRSEVELVFRSSRIGATPGANALVFSLGEGTYVGLDIDAPLAALLVERVLHRPEARVVATDVELPQELRGAVGAIVLAAVRRASRRPPVVELRSIEELIQAFDFDAARMPTVTLEATALFDDSAYALRLHVLSAWSQTVRPDARLRQLGALPVSVPLVAAVSLAEREVFDALTVGDVWVPEQWWTQSDGAGRGALAAPDLEWGLLVDLAPDGRSVLLGEHVRMSIEEPPESESDDVQNVVMNAPIVVRVEVGAVTMSVREWANLRAGDIVETGRRLGEPVILRVAGREVARGELVNVDGEIGVRVTELIIPGE